MNTSLRCSLGALAFSCALLAGCGHPARTATVAASGAPQLAVVGKRAPAWQEPTTTGTSLTLDSLRGKAVYLNFFASWCPPCNEEAPNVNALQKQYAGRGLQVVGVDIMENATKAKQFIDEHHLVYPAVVDSGTLRDQYRVNGLPVHVFIDRSGIVRRIEIGELSRDQMRADIMTIL
ncbi:MAG: TlpA disulfide reductase family protein [Candidatus Baltobacteraceae bacterium]